MSEATQRTIEEVMETANRMGLVCFLPEADEVFLDIDGGCNYISKNVTEVMETNGMTLCMTGKLITTSKSGNQHVYIKTAFDLNEYDRLIIQLALGSDKIKEMLSLIRLREGSESCCALFETPKEARKVEQWRVKYNAYKR